MKIIGILCSGGDSPGMNAAIRAVVRTAIGNNIRVFGIQRGYAGLLQEDIFEMNVSSVGNILQRGGTILQTSRCLEFHKPENRTKAFEILQRLGIEGLVVLGGDGSFNGAFHLHQEHKIPVIGIPCTIDNDISNTQYTIGFDTAVENAVQAVDKIRDTASSHERTFIVEVMGRKSTSIATHVGVATGAETIIFPNMQTDFKEIANSVHRGIKRGKNSSIIIVAEGERPGFCYDCQKELKEKYEIDSHVCILGHIQRGGTPSSLDRFIASQMGYSAVKGLIEEKHFHATAFVEGYVNLIPLERCLEKFNDYQQKYVDLAKTLAI